MLTKIINAFTFAVLISTVGIVGHASAMPESMHGASHSSSPANCINICLSAPTSPKKETPDYKDKEVEPRPPYYLQFDSTQTGWYAEKKLNARTIDQPDKVPKHLRCCIIRV